MAEPGLPRPDDPDWFSKLSCISGQLGKAWTPGATANITSSLTLHLLLPRSLDLLLSHLLLLLLPKQLQLLLKGLI